MFAPPGAEAFPRSLSELHWNASFYVYGHLRERHFRCVQIVHFVTELVRSRDLHDGLPLQIIDIFGGQVVGVAARKASIHFEGTGDVDLALFDDIVPVADDCRFTVI